MRVAANVLDSNLRTEVVAGVKANAMAYADEALDAIIDPAPQWRHLLDGCADQAVEAIEAATYENVAIRFSGGSARVSTRTIAGVEAETAYESADALAQGLNAMGLQRLMLQTHRSVADYIRDAREKLAAL